EGGVPDPRLGLVLVLAAGAARAEDVALEVFVPEDDVDGLIDFGQDIHRGERRMPPRRGVEGADAHQAMDARLAAEVAVGILALDVQARFLDARRPPVPAARDLCLEPLALPPH